jgi:SulP family sulfate permease
MEKMNLKNELLSGLTVALALVPEAVAFAIVAGVDPLVGLYAAFFIGFITSSFGGRPGMISGATGGLAVVMIELVSSHGVQYLFAAVILMGIIQIIVGLLKWGKFIRIIPHPVMLGFVNGLAIVILLAQLNQFKITDTSGDLQWMTGTPLWVMLGLVALTVAIIYLVPKLTKAIPSSLIAIIVVSLIVTLLNIDTRTVGDIASVSGGLPNFSVPNLPLSFETFMIVLPYALIFAAVGLIESLLTLTLIDEITDTRGKSNKECVGLGVANIVTGFFGGMGGCAMIGQSMININSGGKRRISGISASLFLLSFILFGGNLIESIPIAALIGVMFVVVISTFEWSSFKLIKNIKKTDAFIIVLVSGITVVEDLAVAVIVGVIVSSLVFAWEKGKNIDVYEEVDEKGTKIYKIRGALFFGSSRNFLEAFNVKNDPKDVIIDFMQARVFDHSAIDTINTLTEKYKIQNKTLHLKHLSKECYDFIKDSKEIVEINIIEDPKYHVALDELA